MNFLSKFHSSYCRIMTAASKNVFLHSFIVRMKKQAIFFCSFSKKTAGSRASDLYTANPNPHPKGLPTVLRACRPITLPRQQYFKIGDDVYEQEKGS